MGAGKHPRRTINGEKRQDRKNFGMWLFGVVASIFILFTVRFGYIAIFKDVQDHNLAVQANRHYTNSQVIQAKRGTIYDANGNQLATDTSRYTVYAIIDPNYRSVSDKPLYVTDKKRAARVLAKALNLPEKRVLTILSPTQKGSFQVQFGPAGSNLSVATMEQIKRAHLTGINFTETPARQYPEGEFARQLIGLATSKSKSAGATPTLVGQFGLENYFNKQLSGVNGHRVVKQNYFGYTMGEEGNQNRQVKNGDNVTTTLNNRVQHQLETLMGKVYDRTQAESMTGVVMDAKSGKIIAATQRPDMTSKAPAWTNALVQDTFEPGSTMKVLALAAAIDTGNFHPNASYTSGTWAMNGGKITDWVPTGWGNITYKEGFFRSSNVGFAHVEQEMGSATWKKYLHRFGILQKVGVIGMGGEQPGFTSFDHGALEQANTAFGQAITVNVMQLMQAFSAVANNGQMVRPYWIQKVVNPNTNKTVFTGKTKVVGHPISAATARQVRQYMEGVIYDKVGTGQAYQVKGYRIAGKTGTAQIAGTHGYEKGATDNLYSFVGFAPAKDPRYIIYVSMKKPRHLAEPAEKNLASITTPLISYLLDQEKLQKEGQQGIAKVENYRGQPVDNVRASLEKARLKVTVVGSGRVVVAQSLGAGTRAMVNNRMILSTGGKMTMPDITGWSQADVAQLAQLMDLKVDSSGGGFAEKQSIKANSPVKPGQRLTVSYQSK